MHRMQSDGEDHWVSLVPRSCGRPGNEASPGLASFPGHVGGLGMRLVTESHLFP